jgi:transposase-like protein
MVRHLAVWWEKRLAELDAGATAESIAARYGVRVQTLLWWKYERGRRARRASKTQRLLPVMVRSSSSGPELTLTPAHEHLEVSLETKRGRMTLRGTIDAAQLATLAAILRS